MVAEADAVRIMCDDDGPSLRRRLGSHVYACRVRRVLDNATRPAKGVVANTVPARMQLPRAKNSEVAICWYIGNKRVWSGCCAVEA
jgi:hypothetical protein